MKTFKTWLTTIAVLLCGTQTFAYHFEVNGIYYDYYNETACAVTTGDKEYSGSVVLPETVEIWGQTPEVKYISSGAFSNCKGLSSITIPNSVIEIGNSAFSGCTGLTSVTIPNSVTAIGESAFYGCSALTSIKISNAMTYIPATAFACCVDLASVVIPSSITDIRIQAFRECTSLTSITIPNSVIEIGYSAFSGCTGLTSVTIPNSVTAIGESAFNRCDALREIVCESETPATAYNNTFTDIQEKATLKIPAGAKEAYTSAVGWKNFTNIIEYSLTPEYALTYMVNDEVYYTAVIEQGAEIPNIDTPTKEGHTFAGWENLPSIMPDEDVTVYAKFTPNNYTVTFKANGEVVSSESLAYGTTIVAPEAPEIEDYDFVAWADLLEAVPAHDVEFTAVYNQVGIHIIDGGISFSQDETISYNRIRYTRTFTNTKWQALYVPFEIPVTEELLADFEVADLNDIRQYDRDDDGVKDETVVEAFKVKSGATLAANYPYLIRAKEVGEKTITVTDATLYATEEVSIDCSSVHEKFTFTGTYSRKASGELAGCYALCDGIWQPLAADATLGAFRVYLRIESRDSNIAPARAIRMHVVGEDGATDIDELESNANNQQPAVVYDLQGRRITNADNLKGVYIVNGKKVIK